MRTLVRSRVLSLTFLFGDWHQHQNNQDRGSCSSEQTKKNIEISSAVYQSKHSLTF